MLDQLYYTIESLTPAKDGWEVWTKEHRFLNTELLEDMKQLIRQFRANHPEKKFRLTRYEVID